MKGTQKRAVQGEAKLLEGPKGERELGVRSGWAQWVGAVGEVGWAGLGVPLCRPWERV